MGSREAAKSQHQSCASVNIYTHTLTIKVGNDTIYFIQVKISAQSDYTTFHESVAYTFLSAYHAFKVLFVH